MSSGLSPGHGPCGRLRRSGRSERLGSQPRGYRLNVAPSSLTRRLSSLPGGELVIAGIEDRERGVVSVEALLVSIGARRLESLGLTVAAPLPDSELRLYELLAADDSDAAHSRYNALVRRLVSFERAAECAS